MKFIIAIDGPSASGKGTIAKVVAGELGFAYFNTGALYRAVAYFMFKNKIKPTDVRALVSLIKTIDFSKIEELDLYSRTIGKRSSVVGAIPEVRNALLEVQQNFATDKDGIVVEGRDIGTVIFPNANLKIYITADIEERAARRFKQLQKNGEKVIYDDVLRDLQVRDLRDSSRSDAPLTMSKDYFVLDTTKINVGTAVNKILKLFQSAL